jgi:hypothetical protein
MPFDDKGAPAERLALGARRAGSGSTRAVDISPSAIG